MDVPPEVTTALLKGAADATQAAAATPNGRAVLANLSEPAVIVSRTIRNLFLPLALHNEKREQYFNNKFVSDLGEKIEAIPEEHRQDPKPSVIAPAIEGLGYSYEEDDLRDLYLNLLASSVDARRAASVHPGFGEIVKQLTAEEVGALNVLLSLAGVNQPIVRLRIVDPTTGAGWTVHNHLLPLMTGDLRVAHVNLPSWIDNWVRLGLVEVDYTRHLAREGAYEWVEGRPEWASAKAEKETDGRTLTHEKGMVVVTDFGKRFAAAVVAPAQD